MKKITIVFCTFIAICCTFFSTLIFANGANTKSNKLEAIPTIIEIIPYRLKSLIILNHLTVNDPPNCLGMTRGIPSDPNHWQMGNICSIPLEFAIGWNGGALYPYNHCFLPKEWSTTGASISTEDPTSANQWRCG